MRRIVSMLSSLDLAVLLGFVSYDRYPPDILKTIMSLVCVNNTPPLPDPVHQRDQ